MSANCCAVLLLSAIAVAPVPAAGQAPAAVASDVISYNEVLGRPTDHSVTLSVLFDQVADVYFQYGASSGQYASTTGTQRCAAGEPLVQVFNDLQHDTRYYYRTCYKRPSEDSFLFGPEHTFHTQRPCGARFTFTIEADPHPYDKKGSHTLWRLALQNQLKDSADFLIDLGDTFGDDHEPFTITPEEVRELRRESRSFLAEACHSSPLLFCLGNHEGESGYYLLQTPPNNIGVTGTLWRQFYFPNPIPDGFYSGNSSAEGFGIGQPQNYYAWEWGDALFVVLDAYRYYTANAKPRGWDWTIGAEQYQWLKQTLGTSPAKYKFVIAHHTLGETRGGASTATLYEWGGYEADGKTWTFDTNRPGWGMPIHQLMVANGVTVYFQGHDHLFAREDLDGMVYQEVPMPSDSTYIIGVRDNGNAYGGVIFDGSGHLRVTVAPESVLVDYVEARLPADEDSVHRNGRTVYSYSIKPKVTSVSEAGIVTGAFRLEQNYPNPFNPETTIRFHVPALPGRGGSGGTMEPGLQPVDLRVYDILGQEVARLVERPMRPGTHEVTWNATSVPSGVYFYRLCVNGSVETRRAVVLR